MAKLVHMMVRVVDLDRSIQWYRQAFGLEPAARFEFDSFDLVYLRNPENDFELELTANKDRQQPYDLGEGYGHVAVVVDDLDAEHARFTAEGFQPKDIKQLEHGGEKLARFFFVEDPDGYKCEVMERYGRYQ
ncbi:VOC family protein [Rhodovibrio salinarum]|uniref:Aldoketomutase n=1 Tax=Rhodovibrio salinarum TaxID=1087 RepID=A0A934QG63_9PROT|nr:VOC family protein [Rhodovibrio salinarum]MBK1696174.1 lactoylglutathione lyase [Rhodovibrio salinarum]